MGVVRFERATLRRQASAKGARAAPRGQIVAWRRSNTDRHTVKRGHDQLSHGAVELIEHSQSKAGGGAVPAPRLGPIPRTKLGGHAAMQSLTMRGPISSWPPPAQWRTHLPA